MLRKDWREYQLSGLQRLTRLTGIDFLLGTARKHRTSTGSSELQQMRQWLTWEPPQPHPPPLSRTCDI